MTLKFFSKMCVFFFLIVRADVNGKVIHLVQRPPPGSLLRTASTLPSASNNNANNTAETGNRRHSSPFMRAIDGMVLGAMAIPMNANTGVSETSSTIDIIQKHYYISFDHPIIDNPNGHAIDKPIIHALYESHYSGTAHAQLCKQHCQLFGGSIEGKSFIACRYFPVPTTFVSFFHR